jgi:hypothetical protein
MRKAERQRVCRRNKTRTKMTEERAAIDTGLYRGGGCAVRSSSQAIGDVVEKLRVPGG